jgi:UDP-glucose 4-epimerase
MRVFITGGTGFIGSNLVKLLLGNGYQITILARNPEKIPSLRNYETIKIIKGTICDYQIIKDALQGVDAIIHNALGWGNTAVEMVENDTIPSIKIIQQALESGVKKVIYTSSTAAIGEYRNFMDENTVCRPTDLYSATKAASENFILALANHYKVNCNIVRPGYTFGNPIFPEGPMQPDRRIFEIVKSAKENKSMTFIKNDGTQFVAISKLVKLYFKILTSEYNGKIFMGNGDEFITWEEIAEYAVAHTNSSSIILTNNLGWTKGGCRYVNDFSRNAFNIDFNSRELLKEHINYIIKNY